MGKALPQDGRKKRRHHSGQYCALGFFQRVRLKVPKKLLMQLGQVQRARVMKFTDAKEIATKAATIKTYAREAMAAEKAGMKVETKS